ARRQADIDPVDEDSDGGLHGRDRRVHAEAADREKRVTGHAFGQRDVRRGGGEVLQVERVTLVDIDAVDDGERQGNALRIFGDSALVGRDDDALDRRVSLKLGWG